MTPPAVTATGTSRSWPTMLPDLPGKLDDRIIAFYEELRSRSLSSAN
jgi:hypothetical protein